MKTQIHPRKTLLTFSFALALFSLIACKKETDQTAAAVTEEEAVEAISLAVSGESGGMAVQTETAASIAGNSVQECGVSTDTMISRSGNSAGISFEYGALITRTLSCNNNIPQQLVLGYTGANTYSTLRMSSADSSMATLTLEGVLPESASYVINETYLRKGTQQSKVWLQRAFSSTLEITAAAITVNKTTLKIVSGTATVSFTGSVTGGKTVSYGGSLQFLGNNRATLQLNNGNSYLLEW